jgi:pyridoxal phosphate enzyme (YggS family)
MDQPPSFAGRLSSVRARIAAAAERAGRDPAAVRLIAVSKGQPVGRIREARAAGQRDFGENYLEEAEPKIRALPEDIAWHMIGHVQSRKAAGVCGLFSCVHSVDSLRLAERLSRFASERGRRIGVLLECNVSGEESKSGWPAADPAEWDSLLRAWEPLPALPGISILGLMTMAPYAADPEAARPVFRRLRGLSHRAQALLPQGFGAELSMGMTDDFEAAVEEGATLVRIGRARFGPRRNAVRGPEAPDPVI